MRTLTRPMFNMGGPIKQGIMHGIREPKKDGGLSQQFNTGLVGDERYPKTSGREHHVGFLAPMLWTAGRALARPFGSWAMKQVPKLTRVKWRPGGSTPSNLHKGYPGGTAKGSWERGKTIMGQQEKFVPNWLGKQFINDPLAGAAMSGKGFVGGAAKKALSAGKYAFGTPSGLLFMGLPVTYAAGKYFLSDGKEITGDDLNKITQGPPGGGDPGMTYTKPGPSPKSQAEKDAFARSQREKRVNKYLDLMGYDRSKKMAIADALIDASKIVGDRGSLDPKNITQELINPVIQATSKRLDKPQQIREAVGLMSMKAEIEKDVSKEKDALAKSLTMKNIELADRKLEQGFETDIRNLLLTARTPPKKKQLEQYARLTADKYGETFTVVEGEGDMKGDGIYMVGEAIIRVTDGAPKRIA